MKNLFAALLALASSVAFATTTVPVQLLNPTGSSSGQAIVSTGASTAPAWGNAGVNGGGTGLATITAHGVMLGEGTGNVATVGPCATTGQSIISQGASADPVCGYPTGTLIGVQRFTASGTYTPDAGTNSVIVEIQGAGGAGGGAPATSAGQVSTGAGGGSGGYIKHRMTSGFSGATVTIGSAGTGAAGGNGGNGGNTSFAGITANGGTGGAVAAASSSVSNAGGGTGGAASGGSILNIAGASPGTSLYTASPASFIGAIGGNSMLGFGGFYGPATTGGAGTGFGSGGGGTFQNPSGSALTGGSGSGGIVLVWEYN